MPSLRSGMIEAKVGTGSTTTSRSSFSIAFFISGRRVCEFAAWPQNTIARILSGWSMLSFFSSTPSIQRETGMPLLSISFWRRSGP